jgi:hypothetical protein
VSYLATVYNVFIASPSDTEDERKQIPLAIYAWNADHSRHYGAVLLPVLWETHAAPQMGIRPQEAINIGLVDRCDILIGTFHSKIGSPTGKAESGTVEEIERFVAAEKRATLYFSQAPLIQRSFDSDQYTRLNDFKKRCQAWGIYSAYDSVPQLVNKIKSDLTKFMNEIHVGAKQGAAMFDEQQRQQIIEDAAKEANRQLGDSHRQFGATAQ